MAGDTTLNTTSLKTVRVAVVGAGRIGEVHLLNLTANANGVEVTGVFDADHERSGTIAAKFSVPVRSMLEVLMHDSELEAVVIDSPSALHLEHVKAAALGCVDEIEIG
jgi:myo-inositol 2-dehydrogenase / D-chiro-inositol 1-dehydrogenase